MAVPGHIRNPRPFKPVSPRRRLHPDTAGDLFSGGEFEVFVRFGVQLRHAVVVLLLIFAAVYISAIKAGDAGGAGVIAGAGTALIGIGQWRSK